MLYNCKEGSSFCFTDNNKSVYVHKDILSNYSNYYKNQFTNGWKNEDILVVDQIKPYEFVMEYIYKWGKNLTKFEFNNHELFELCDYTNRTLMLEDDLVLRDLVFVIIYEYLYSTNNFDITIFDIVMSIMKLTFKDTNNKLDDIRNKIIRKLAQHINITKYQSNY